VQSQKTNSPIPATVRFAGSRKHPVSKTLVANVRSRKKRKRRGGIRSPARELTDEAANRVDGIGNRVAV
jgi:ribosome assembly protein YihI (activator of Der GTPase)